MVERLFTRDVENNCECNVTNLINKRDSFRENLPTSVDCSFLPTINENLEGFQSAISDQRTKFNTFRARRNSHPVSFRESLTRTNSAVSASKLSGSAIKCKQRHTTCRKCKSRDPMLSFKARPKQNNIVFDKHKLDKIDEGDSLTECEENVADSGEGMRRQNIVNISSYSKNMTGRRSSYPADSTPIIQGNNLTQDFRDYTQCQKDIVSKWMKFF